MRAHRIIGAAAAVTAVLAMPTAAGATEFYVGTPPTQVEGVELVKPVQVAGVQDSRDPATLPVTGGDLAGMALFGAGAVALGTVLVRRSRPARVVA